MAKQSESPRTPMGNAWRMLLNAVIVLASIYGGLCILMYLFQAKLLFIPTDEIYRTPESVGWEYEDLMLEVGEERTHAWYIPAPESSKGVILFSHGNAGNIADRIESVSIFRDLGYDVLVYDYGGYGKSSGAPSEDRSYADIRAMWDYLTESRGVAPENIVLFGRSLGAGATCQLAREVHAGAVVIESAFLSVPKMAKELYPIFPTGSLVRHRFENDQKVARIDSPLLVIHSPDDSIIPFHHGKKLFELATEPKEFLEIKGDHNEGFWMSGELYTDGLQSFFSKYLNSGVQPVRNPSARDGA